MKFSPLLDDLIRDLRILPGVGPKSAQRMAFQLLERDRSRGLALAKSLSRALTEIGHCRSCCTFTENELCEICASSKRAQKRQLCVVETPADVVAIEQTNLYSGQYFVLMGHLSPLDGIGPDDIGLDRLEQRLAAEKIQEVILATNPTGYPVGSGCRPRNPAITEHSAWRDRSAWSCAGRQPSSASQNLLRSACGSSGWRHTPDAAWCAHRWRCPCASAPHAVSLSARAPSARNASGRNSCLHLPCCPAWPCAPASPAPPLPRHVH